MNKVKIKGFLNTILTLFLLLPVMTMSIYGKGKIVIMTEEYSSFRRIIVTIPYSRDVFTEITKSPKLGEFTITITNIDSTEFRGRKQIQVSGAIPLQLITSYQNNNTLQIKGLTTPFLNMVGFDVFEEDLIIFDIYHDIPFESTFREVTIPSFGFYNHDNGSAGYMENAPIRNEVNPILGSNRKRFTYAVFISGIIFAVLFGVVLVISFVNNRKQKDTTAPSEKAKQQDNIDVIIGDDELLNMDNTEENIRRIMNERGLSYDEANLFIHVAGKGRHNNG